MTTKFSSAVTSSRKAYFQVNLGTANVNATSSATFTIYFKNSYTQRVQLWALNQEYSAFSSAATWSTAQANDTLSNGMLTTGVAAATAIGSSVMLQPGASPYTPATFTIPNIGSYLKGGKVTLVLTGLDVTTADTTAGLANSSSGARYTLGTASLQVTLNNGANTPPTISPIANRSLSEDKLPSLISFTILDGQTPPENLVVSFQSNHPEKIPVENIILGGTGSNRTIQITPLPNSNGTTNIKVLVTDFDGAVASESFDITLTPVNDAPNISNIPDQVMDANTSRSAIPCIVGDVDNDPAALTVSASSSDQALIPNSGLLISGIGSERALSITPSPNQTGTCTITVTVTDGLLSSSDTFTVTVNPVNTPPSISDVLDQSMAMDTVGGPWSFTIADIETSTTALQVSASSSNPTLLPNSGILLSGEGVDRAIQVTPISGQFGQTTITLTVSDGTLLSSDSFILKVSPSFASLFAGQGASSDDDGDGVLALVEYGLGGSATTSDSDKLPRASVLQDPVLGESLAMMVVERVNDPSLRIFPETSAEVSFLILGSTPTRSVSTDQGGVPPGFARVTYSVPIDGKSKQFLRLRFQSTP